MTNIDNHYEFLGLEVSASVREIRRALDVVALEADALVYISPERSHQLWERIRQIRHDLLDDRKRRAAYDTALIAAHPEIAPESHLFELEPHVRQAIAQTRPVPSTPIAPPTRQPQASSDRRPVPYLAGLAAGLVAAAAVAIAILGHPAGHAPVTAIVVAPSPGRERGISGASGSATYRIVHLPWSPVRGASHYRVQYASGFDQVDGAGVFRHAKSVSVTGSASYALHATVGRLYAWRVQAYVHGRWTSYSSSRYFYVTAPPVHHTVQHRQPPLVAARSPHHRRAPNRATTRKPAHRRPVLAAGRPPAHSTQPAQSAPVLAAAVPIRSVAVAPSAPRPAVRRSSAPSHAPVSSPPSRTPRTPASPPAPPPAPPAPTPAPTQMASPTHAFGLSAPGQQKSPPVHPPPPPATPAPFSP